MRSRLFLKLPLHKPTGRGSNRHKQVMSHGRQWEISSLLRKNRQQPEQLPKRPESRSKEPRSKAPKQPQWPLASPSLGSASKLMPQTHSKLTLCCPQSMPFPSAAVQSQLHIPATLWNLLTHALPTGISMSQLPFLLHPPTHIQPLKCHLSDMVPAHL